MNDEILVFFDSNIFTETGFDFQRHNFYSNLLELKTKYPNLYILVFPILYHEIIVQIMKKIEKNIQRVDGLKKSLADNEFGSYANALDLSKFDAEEFKDSKVSELKEFLSSFTEVENFELSNQTIQYNTIEVISDFFEKKAPFTDKKKYEFKDLFPLTGSLGE